MASTSRPGVLMTFIRWRALRFLGGEEHAHRGADLSGLAGQRQPASRGVDLVHGDAIVILAAGDEPLAAGVDAEAARHFDARRSALDPLQLAVRGDGENRDGVVAAIRDVEPLPSRVTEYFRGGQAGGIDAIRKRGN